MFGYIFPDKPELKVKEYELFKAYYCGLCKSIGGSCGQVARFALNYDSSFLGMLLSSFNEESEVIRFERCPASPAVRKPVIRESPALEYAADMNIILAYYKLKDDWNDERSIGAAALMGMLYSAYKRAYLRNREKEKSISRGLKELYILENSNCKSVDQASEPFAKITQEIFTYPPLCSTEKREKHLKWFGYNIGKWIYIIDAYDDIESDIKGKNYNPILSQFCYNNEEVSVFKKRIRENIGFTLTYTLSQIGKTFELLDLKKNEEIVENIIYGGMYNKTLQVLDGKFIETLNKRGCVKNEKPL